MSFDPDRVKGAIRAAWGLGDYGALGRLLEPAAQAVIDGAAVSAGQEVLDVAAGDGNVAVLAAREGADVVASDFAPEQVEAGRRRTDAEGLDVEWVVADAEELPFDDARFDAVLSTFGVMFAPRPDVVARELFRVVRPGGTVGLAAWTPEGFQGQSFAIGRRFQPPPEGLPASTEWGDPDLVRERLGPYASRVETELRTLPFAFRSRDAMRSFFLEHAGPAQAAQRSMDPERYRAMEEVQARLVDDWNQATDGSVLIEVEYLLAVARRPG